MIKKKNDVLEKADIWIETWIKVFIIYNLAKFILYYFDSIPKTLLLVHYITILFLNAVLYRVEACSNSDFRKDLLVICIMIAMCGLISSITSSVYLLLLSLIIGMALGVTILVISIINSKRKSTLVLRIAMLLLGILFLSI